MNSWAPPLSRFHAGWCARASRSPRGWLALLTPSSRVVRCRNPSFGREISFAPPSLRLRAPCSAPVWRTCARDDSRQPVRANRHLCARSACNSSRVSATTPPCAVRRSADKDGGGRRPRPPVRDLGSGRSPGFFPCPSSAPCGTLARTSSAPSSPAGRLPSGVPLTFRFLSRLPSSETSDTDSLPLDFSAWAHTADQGEGPTGTFPRGRLSAVTMAPAALRPVEWGQLPPPRLPAGCLLPVLLPGDVVQPEELLPPSFPGLGVRCDTPVARTRCSLSCCRAYSPWPSPALSPLTGCAFFAWRIP